MTVIRHRPYSTRNVQQTGVRARVIRDCNINGKQDVSTDTSILDQCGVDSSSLLNTKHAVSQSAGETELYMTQGAVEGTAAKQMERVGSATPLKSDITIGMAKFEPSAIEEIPSRPKWYEVGVEKYREMRKKGQTPFTKPKLLPQALEINIPSREANRKILCRLMYPSYRDTVGKQRQCKGSFLHIHGGGWVYGDHTFADDLLQIYADAGDLAVLSVNYRLAPEDPYPAGLEDCIDIGEYLVKNSERNYGGPLRFIGGESAGGHLSLLVTFHLLEFQPTFRLSGLILPYGWYDLTMLPSARNSKLDSVSLQKFTEKFLPGMSTEGKKSPSISPYYKNLRPFHGRLPSALFICGTEDMFLDDSVGMNTRWETHGGKSILKLYPGARHGFIDSGLDVLGNARTALEDTKTYIQECMADVHITAIWKPDIDRNTYRFIKLENELKVLLVSDPEANKASVSFTYEACTLDSVPGMKWAVANIVTQGTEVEPEENSFLEFVQRNHGTLSSSTFGFQTTFNVGVHATETNESKVNSPLYEVFRRLGDVLMKPLFNQTTVSKIFKTMEQKYTRDKGDEMIRNADNLNLLNNPDHPFYKEWLSRYDPKILCDAAKNKGVPEHVMLRESFEAECSANRAAIVVVDRIGVDKLQELVEQHLSPLKNDGRQRLQFENYPTFLEPGMQIFCKTNSSVKAIRLLFPSFKVKENRKSKPWYYIDYCLGYGSLEGYLQKKGWIENIKAGALRLPSCMSQYSISSMATPEGIRNYKVLLKIIFYYLGLMRESPPKKQIFRDYSRMYENNFRFEEKNEERDMTSKLSVEMLDVDDYRNILRQGSTVDEFDPKAISSAVETLDPRNFNLAIFSLEYPEELFSGSWDQKGGRYGGMHNIKKLPDQLIEELSSAYNTAEGRPDELHLPLKNKYIPENFSVDETETAISATMPQIIQRDPIVWYKKYDGSKVPKIRIEFFLRTPLLQHSVHMNAAGKVFCQLFLLSLKDEGHTFAGLSVQLKTRRWGLLLRFGGFNDKLHLLVETALKAFLNVRKMEAFFQLAKYAAARNIKASFSKTSVFRIREYFKMLLFDKFCSHEELLSAVEKVSVDDVFGFHLKLVSKYNLEIFMNGGTQQEARVLADRAKEILAPPGWSQLEWDPYLSIQLKQGSNTIFKQPQTLDSETNYSVCLRLCIGKYDVHLSARLKLLEKLIEEPFTTQLYTNESFSRVLLERAFGGRLIGISFYIQSSDHSCTYLDGRLEEFLSSFGKTLSEMSDDKFKDHRRSGVQTQHEAPKNLTQETARFQKHFERQDYNFNQRNEVADVLGKLEKPEMIEFYKLFIMPTSPHRTKLSLHLEPKTPPPPNVPKAEDGRAELGTVTYTEDLHEWKRKMPREKPMWPLVSQDKLMELWSVK